MKALYWGDLAKLALATFTSAAIGFERESQIGQPERRRIYLSAYALSHDAVVTPHGNFIPFLASQIP